VKPLGKRISPRFPQSFCSPPSAGSIEDCAESLLSSSTEWRREDWEGERKGFRAGRAERKGFRAGLTDLGTKRAILGSRRGSLLFFPFAFHLIFLIFQLK